MVVPFYNGPVDNDRLAHKTSLFLYDGPFDNYMFMHKALSSLFLSPSNNISSFQYAGC